MAKVYYSRRFGRAEWLPEEKKAPRPCLRCGAIFVTTKYRRICDKCTERNAEIFIRHSARFVELPPSDEPLVRLDG